MKKFVRVESPKILQDNWERIGDEYTAKRSADPSYRFQWPQIDNERLNRTIIPALKVQTGSHCSYCDKFPLLRGDESIDHFKPKTEVQFYREVCKWDNLYLACKHCQDSKNIQYNLLLLRPDDDNYRFLRYFTYNYNEHRIDTNPAAAEEEKLMAEETIKVFDLNHPSMKISRRHAFERYSKSENPDPEDYNFRFLFEQV